MKRILQGLGIGLLALVVVVLGAILWMLNTASGAAWVARLASERLEDRLIIGNVTGTIAGPLTLRDLQYRDPQTAMSVAVERVTADVELLALLRGEVRVRNAELQGTHVELGEPQPEEPREEPFSLDPPIDIVVERFAAEDAAIERGAERLVTVRRAAFAGSWTGTGIAVEALELLAAEGEVAFDGEFASGERYAGSGQGRFRWDVGERTFAGRMNVDATGAQAQLELEMLAPLVAHLDATVEQTDEVPWRFTLEVPHFDPRRQLMPDGAVQSLSASLRGAGTLAQGTVTGQILVDDFPVRIDPLRFARTEERIELDPLIVRLGEQGTLETRGEVALADEPWRARIDANWQDVEIPPRWAGQPLHTHGELQFSGNTATHASQGRISIGPPDKLVDVALDIDGTPQAIQVRELALVQATGRLTAEGTVELEPRLGWQLRAQASRFDPGALASEWPGDLSFALRTQGQMAEAGPDASLVLRDLVGTLRNRAVAGSAELTLTPARVLAGTLDLRSGSSRVSLRGERGEELSAVATLAVPDLGDWLPDARGNANGRVTARGPWPQLEIAARVNGGELRVADAEVGTLSLAADFTGPEQLAGSARVDAQQVTAAGFEFESIAARATGDREQHSLSMTASGDPLGTELRLAGSQTDEGWSGTLEQLVLDITDIAPLALQSPAALELAGGNVALEQTCLASSEGMRLCAALDSRADGSLSAEYSLDAVRLALVNAVMPELPIALQGMLEGAGNIRRTSAGELHGQARIVSPSGRLASVEIEDEALLTYSDLSLTADLAGTEAHATLGAQLGEGGELRGSVALSGLGEIAIDLDGEASATIPSLAPIMLFVPQLAELEGRAQALVNAAGTLQQPEISGELLVSDLATQVPELGLNLTEGRVRAAPAADRTIDIDGEIHSGDGRLTFEGRVNEAGHVRLRAGGKDFLAADIPAARVVIAPQVQFERDSQGMSLTGEVTVPSARVDLANLPQAGPQGASEDVVVVDEEASREEAEALPLTAEITVILGDAEGPDEEADVELTGFGLEAELSGRLTVHEKPGEPTTGSGEVGVQGTYRAYGQDLTIERGQLLFAATPLDNPRLSITAFRQVEQIRAGLQIGGTARNPQLSVFSNPSMGQAEALSYLVTGRPLDSIGSGAGEGDALQSAARSLGTAGGGLLARSIGGRLGVDEIGIEEDEMIGGSAFTVGEYLSPRLYLSYGVGIFEPGEVISLRYRLSDEFSVQAARGPSDTRAGLEYRTER